MLRHFSPYRLRCKKTASSAKLSSSRGASKTAQKSFAAANLRKLVLPTCGTWSFVGQSHSTTAGILLGIRPLLGRPETSPLRIDSEDLTQSRNDPFELAPFDREAARRNHRRPRLCAAIAESYIRNCTGNFESEYRGAAVRGAGHLAPSFDPAPRHGRNCDERLGADTPHVGPVSLGRMPADVDC